MTDSPAIEGALAAATATLAAAGIDTARVDAEWLLAEVLGVRRGELWLARDRALPPASAARYAEVVRRRAVREPLQQIVGTQAFRGLTLRVTRDVLVPRPETEALVEWALAWLPRGPARAVDVGTGSGCIACALAAEREDVRVLALDSSPEAAAVARDNVAALGFAGRVTVVVADLLTPLAAGRADLVVANPPYLPTALLPTLPAEVIEHEPRVALDGGDDGLTFIRPIVATARACLRPGGALVLETAGADQAPIVAALLRGAGYADVEIRSDLGGVARLTGGRR